MLTALQQCQHYHAEQHCNRMHTINKTQQSDNATQAAAIHLLQIAATVLLDK